MNSLYLSCSLSIVHRTKGASSRNLNPKGGTFSWCKGAAKKSLPARLVQDLRVHNAFWLYLMVNINDGLCCLHSEPYYTFPGQGSSVGRKNHIVQLL